MWFKDYNTYTAIDLDVDECAGTNDCDEHAICSDATGSYTCVCKTGYTGNGFTCNG